MNMHIHSAKPDLHVEQKIELGMSPADVWDIVGNFGRWQDWHPAVTASDIVRGVNHVPGAIRRSTLAGGGTVDDQLMVYEPQNRLLRVAYSAGDFPVSDYLATLAISAHPDPGRSTLVWRASFKRADRAARPAPGRDDATATAAVKAVLSAGLHAVGHIVAERKAILQVIDLYASGDALTVARAFHPSATMKYVLDDHLVDEPIGEFLTHYLPPGGVEPRTLKIDHVDLLGTAASARLTIDYPTYQFIDYFNLLKIEGRWLVVGKIFHRRQKT